MQVTLDARDLLQSHGILARVVSILCVEAGSAAAGEKIIGDAAVAVERESIHDAQNGTRPGGRPATFAPAVSGTSDRPA